MKKKTAIIIAIFSGILGVFLIMSYISKVEEEAALESNMKNVIVAKEYIPKYSFITPNMVKIIQIPSKYLQPGSISSIKELIDKNNKPKFVTLVPIRRGEVILTTKLTIPGRDTGLSVVIPMDKRAISIPISPETGIEGLIKPGNRVDLIATFENKSVFLLQNLLVLSVGNRIIGEIEKEEKKRGLFPGFGEGMIGGNNITLAVTPTEALKIAYARDKCNFSIVLRSATDNKIVKVSPITKDNLLERKAKKREEIKIYRGTQSIREFAE